MGLGPDGGGAQSGRKMTRCSLARRWHNLCKVSTERCPTAVGLQSSPYYCRFYGGLMKTSTSRRITGLHSIWWSLERKGICWSCRQKLKMEGQGSDPPLSHDSHSGDCFEMPHCMHIRLNVVPILLSTHFYLNISCATFTCTSSNGLNILHHTNCFHMFFSYLKCSGIVGFEQFILHIGGFLTHVQFLRLPTLQYKIL